MEYLTISKLHVNKLSEANSSSCWKWLKIILRESNSEIYSFQISENREHFVASSASVCHFFFRQKSKHSVALLWLGITNQRFHGKYSVQFVSLEMKRKEKLKAT